MKDIIVKYIDQTEALLLNYPNDKSIKSYLLRLKSLKSVPDVLLKGFDSAIPKIYEILASDDFATQKKPVIQIFSVMVRNVKAAAQYQKMKAKNPDIYIRFFENK